MKDILLISFFSKNETPYIDIYIDSIKSSGVTYDVLYFERYDMNYQPSDNEIIFKEYCPTGGKKISKIGTMYRYATFLRKIVCQKQYNALIVFATVPAIMISGILNRRYKGRYVLDIRDYTHELNKAYYKIEDKLIKNAFATVISSSGFKKFLPKCDYIISHNTPKDYEGYTEKNVDNNWNTDELVIGFVGSIRYYDENCRLIEQFAKKKNYLLRYYGTVTADCDLEGYCEDNRIDNVEFKGRFNNNEKESIYKCVDVINSIYGVNNYETISALPNRLYDACIYQKPIIVSKGTYLAEVVEKYGIGIAVDVFEDDVPKLLDDYISSVEPKQFTQNCNRFMGLVKKDMKQQQKTIEDFVEHITALDN